MTELIRIDPEKLEEELIDRVVNVFKKGGLVAFPTETVYGLGALVSKRDSIRRIYEVKGRPMDNPLIIHVDKVEMFIEYSREPPDVIVDLLKRFWPGPLTVVYWRNNKVPDEATASLPKAAFRSPAHPVALEFIKRVGEAIAAPSANKSGKPSPTRAEHVYRDLYGLVDVIVDSGDTLYGVESTIIDFTVNPPRLLRPGAIPVEVVEEHIGVKIDIPPEARGLSEFKEALAPGMKYRHYAPDAELVVVETRDYVVKLSKLIETVRKLVVEAKDRFRKIAILCSEETCGSYVDLNVYLFNIGSRENLFTVAKRLFSALRDLDENNIEFAVAEGFEELGLGLTIMNRLRKASMGNVILVD